MNALPRTGLVLAVLLGSASLIACSSDETTGTGGASSSKGVGAGAGTGTGTGGSGGGAGGSGAGPVSLVDCSAPTGAVPALKLTPIATGLDKPLLAKGAPEDPTRLYILEQTGKVKLVKDGMVLPTPFLDVNALLPTFNPAGDERGLLGLAFHPNFKQNGRFFVHHSDKNGDTTLEEYHAAPDADVADPVPVATVLTQDQPQPNHNGGAIEFSPKDGFLYMGLGDGGGANDQHGAAGNGQNMGTFLGKILRIDVSTVPYKIPPGNMVGDGVLPEIWDFGMRNPWRFSFDACTADLYIGDVGQDEWEEVDVEPAGKGNNNYGWRLKEGTHCFNPTTACDDSNKTVPPIVEYSHADGCSIGGGYVYRGAAIPALRGTYFYADLCDGTVWSLVWTDGATSASINLTADLKTSGRLIDSFGQDALGEVYIVDYAGSVFRIDAE